MPDKSDFPAASPRPLLLIVDDDPLISDTLAYSLASSFEVLISPSRTHCASLLRQLRQPPDLALVDLGLPPLPHQPDEGFALIGELLALSGERNPYPQPLGRIAPGAFADLLVADGDPTVNLDFLSNPEQNLRLIMKDGKVYKNTL